MNNLHTQFELKPNLWFELDDDGYPTEESFEYVKNLPDDPKRFAEFMVYEFPHCTQMYCAHYNAYKAENIFEEIVVKFSTGGWSGCEELLGYIMDKKFSHWMSHSK